MKYLTVYLLSIVVGVLLVGCQLLGSGDSNGNKPTSSYFPLTPGSTWTYAQYDSTYSNYEIKKLYSDSQTRVTVTILKNVQVDSNHVKSLWQFQFPGHTDTAFVSSASDSVRLEIPSLSYGPATFILPLSIGQKWSGKGINGTFSVVSPDTLLLNGLNFSKAWQIMQYPEEMVGNEYVGIDYWVQPGVGIVKADKRDNCTVCGTYNVVVWELLSYNLNPQNK